MLKKIALGAVILTGLIDFGYAEPKDFKLISNRDGFKTYLKKDNSISVVVAKSYKTKIKFGVGFEGYNYKGHRTFKRINIKDHYDNNDDGSIYMAINGQFFAWRNYSPLSFPVKSEYDILQNKILEAEKGKRLLAILRNGIPFIYKGKGSKNSIQKQIQVLVENDIISDAIVGIDPLDESSIRFSGPTTKKGRSMIGCKPYSNYDKGYIGVCKELYFFTAKSSSHKNILEEVKSWGIKDDYIIMGDGSGSAQMFSRELQYNGKDFSMPGDNRPFPNSILLYKK